MSGLAPELDHGEQSVLDHDVDPEQGPDRRPLHRRIVLAPIRVWMWTAPVRTPRCRFDPTCSTYAIQAIDAYGPLRGSWLAFTRVARCHPWNPGGVDPVPDALGRRRSA